MHIDMTEEEFKSFIRQSTTAQIVEFLVEEGLTLKAEKPTRGVYKRAGGQDLIEYDGHRWIPFSHWLVGSKIAWTVGRESNCTWKMVLDDNYEPVVNGEKIVVDQDGTILKMIRS